MSEKLCLDYDNIFVILRKIIIERDFEEIINFEKIIREQRLYDFFMQDERDQEIEIINLCALYIFCVMLKKDEEDIFPFLREYVLDILIDMYPFMEESEIKEQLNDFYDLKNNSIEQRYLFILAAFGYNCFNSNLGLEESDELDNKTINKLLLKIYMTHYTQFNTEIIRGLFLLHRYGDKFKSNLDPSSILIFETILRNIIILLVNFDANKEDQEEFEIIDQAEKMNLV